MPTLLRDLIERYGDDPEKVVALVKAMGPNAVEHLLPSLTDEVGIQRTLAAQLLAMLGDTRAVDPLIAALRPEGLLADRLLNKSRQSRRECYRGLASSRDDLFQEVYNQEVAQIRCHCAFALGMLGDSRAVPSLRLLLTSPDDKIQQTARNALAVLGVLS